MNEQEKLTQIFRIFDPSLPRLGPGDDESTKRALALLPEEIRRPDKHVLDLGCGTGAQTLSLARNLAGQITAVDFHQPYLDALMSRAGKAGCADRIHPLCADMATITPEQGPFDLVWCESALFIMGFANGLRHCRRLLKSGFLAVSELNWLGKERPQACLDFFARENLPVLEIGEYLPIIRESGFKLLGHFVMPDSSWWTGFYNPVGQRLTELRRAFPDDRPLLEMVANVESEIDVFRRYSRAYGYVFYVMQA